MNLPCGDTKLQILQKLQNRAARIVTSSAYDASAANLIQGLSWPTIADIIKAETSTMVFKSINGLAPEYLSEMFTKCSENSHMNLRNTESDRRVPLMRTKNGQKFFSYRGARLWNLLSSDAKMAPSIGIFNRLTK